MGRVLVASLALHLAVGVALARLRPPGSARRGGPIELVVTGAREPRPPSQSSSLPPPPARPLPPRALATRANDRTRTAATPSPLIAPPPVARAAHEPSAHEPSAHEPSAHESSAHEPSAHEPPARDSAAQEPHAVSPPARAPNLFAPSALAKAADLSMAPTAADRAWRPRHGVGGDGAAGGVDVGSFLAEDAARLRVAKGAVAPELRSAERRLDDAFAPTFTQADISNRAELFLKQFRGFLRDPPKTGELQRGLDPTKETLEEKMRSRQLDRAFFLGRRVEVFVRQRSDGSIIEMAVRNPSGYRGFDDVALVAVEKALGGRLPGGSAGERGEVRTLWQLDATAYVVVSPEPHLVFDESTGKREWIYPLQKRVDHHVRLVAVY